MTLRRPPAKAKRDANEPIILTTLEAFGFSVFPLDLPLDAVVGYGGRTFLVEVKAAKGQLTDAQRKFLETWRGQHIVLRTHAEAAEWAREVGRGEL